MLQEILLAPPAELDASPVLLQFSAPRLLQDISL